jgi:hypothetical protein
VAHVAEHLPSKHMPCDQTPQAQCVPLAKVTTDFSMGKEKSLFILDWTWKQQYVDMGGMVW